MVITIENGSLTNDTTLRADPVNSFCSAEKADQKLVRHMLKFLLTGIKTIAVKTVDIDFFIAFGLLSFRGNCFSKMFVWLGIGKLVSSFFNHGECKFWDRCFDLQNESLLT